MQRIDEMISVLRVRQSWDVGPSGARMPKHLVKTELGAGLTDGDLIVTEMPLSSATAVHQIVELRRYLQQSPRQFDAILVEQGLGLRLAALRAAKLLSPKLAMISYDPYPSLSEATQSKIPSMDNSIRKILYRQISLMIVVSSVQAQWLDELLPKSTKISAIPMAIDKEVFYRDSPAKGEYVFMVDGHLRDYETLSKALSLMDARPQRFVLAHLWPLSESAESHLREIESLGVAVEKIPGVSFSELRMLYQDSAAVVSPQRFSHQPVGLTALLESMTMGCAIVATGAKSIVEYAPAGEVAFVKEEDPQALAQALTRVLTDRNYNETLRRRARERSLDYSFEVSQQKVRTGLLAAFGRQLDAR